MTKRQKYFLKQRLLGLFTIIIAAITMPIALLYEALIATVMLCGVGLMLLLTREMVIVDDYFFEVENRKKSRRR